MTADIPESKWVRCDSGWVYDQSEFISTIGSKWDLVCGESWKVEMINTFYMSGWLIGCIIIGPISDRFGRKKTVLGCHFVRCIGCYLSLYSPLYELFAFGRVIMGITSPNVTLTLYVILSEITSLEWRSTFGISWNLLGSVGGMLIPWIAYFVRDYFNLMAIYMWPLLLYFAIVLFLDESPRWLVSQGREEEAIKILNRIAKVNKVSEGLPEGSHFKEEQAKREVRITGTRTRGNYLDLFKTPNMRKRNLIVLFEWFTLSLIFYGLSLNTGRLPGSVYLNSFLMSAIEIPANFTGMLLLRHLGRKWTTGGATLMAGFSSLICVPFLLDSNVATAFSVLGKAGATCAFACIYVYTGELNPTNIRSIAFGTASMCARMSGMAAPFVGGPLGDIWAGLPSLLFGIFGIVAGSLVLLLPETLGQTLPETVEEAENFGKK
ncbi:hypothetical protein CAPTEDRAFT_106525 [Capitella teleta]|uniref:Major facilitator superfamily (MFS) profile domain-containing protein n=1 Tax=Capitella teleta TaxID=283909 RepID=R7VK83_CAPTE|nr:hypothetical protein CAPTEDRAFT_106525 [Capitella teleta]|eukprot:ELU16565.1 hypothetical protein CAPTEDRAFT_106525 [Capitella teleta]